MKIKVISIIILAISANALAVDDKQVAKCAAVDGDLARLVCYDKLAKDNNLMSKQEIPTSIEERHDALFSQKIIPLSGTLLRPAFAV